MSNNLPILLDSMADFDPYLAQDDDFWSDVVSPYISPDYEFKVDEVEPLDDTEDVVDPKLELYYAQHNAPHKELHQSGRLRFGPSIPPPPASSP